MHIFRSIGARCLTRYRLIQVNLVLNRFPRRFRQCFLSDYKNPMLSWCSLQSGKPAHARTYNQTHTHWLKDVHTLGKYKITKRQQNYWGTSTHPFVSLLFFCVFFFSCTVNGSLSQTCIIVYIIWVIYRFNFLSFIFLVCVICSYFVSEQSTTCKKCMYLTRSLKKKHGATICTTLDCLFILRSSSTTKKRN